jgi:hypothetical protein
MQENQTRKEPKRAKRSTKTKIPPSQKLKPFQGQKNRIAKGMDFRLRLGAD